MPSSTPSAEIPAAEVTTAETRPDPLGGTTDATEELLVEEVSIDGMCGVY